MVSARPSARTSMGRVRASGEEHRGLPGGVAAADHDHVFAPAQLRLHRVAP